MKLSPNRYPVIQTIEVNRTSWTRWAGSVTIHAVVLAVLIGVSRIAPLPADPEPEQQVSLIEPVPHVAPRIHVKPTPRPAEIHRTEFQAPKPRTFVAPRIKVQSAPAVSQIAPPEVARLDLPDLHLPKADPIRIEAPAPPPAPRVVKVGGFGNPVGAAASPASSPNRPAAPQLGQFDLSPGNNSGHGVAAKAVASAGFGDTTPGSAVEGHGHGTVQSGGFGDAAAGAAWGNGNQNRGVVRSAGFGAPETVAPAAHVARAAAPADTPVEITFKPKPVYTVEARSRKIQGEVLLEVLFSATGEIHVIRVTRGLGFGLDEAAREAASHIRFHPGTRGGTPVDMKGAVHILFELS